MNKLNKLEQIKITVGLFYFIKAQTKKTEFSQISILNKIKFRFQHGGNRNNTNYNEN